MLYYVRAAVGQKILIFSFVIPTRGRPKCEKKKRCQNDSLRKCMIHFGIVIIIILSI